MSAAATTEPTALGLRVRTGRALAVVLVGPLAAPRVVARHELVLHDEGTPDSLQPWHAALELEPGAAEATVSRLSDVVRRSCAVAVGEMLDELARTGLFPRAAGLVVGSLADPGAISNPHMHAHAAEGQLFREAVVAALEQRDVPATAHAEKELHEHAARALRRTEGLLDRAVAAMGKPFGKPWRLEERFAALAAWIALSGAEAG